MLGEYADALGVDLSFQDFERELRELPGDYVAPGGGLWIAFAGAAPAGCVALRKIDRATCEMKRLYVRPGARGLGLGRKLALHVIAHARRRGYQRMRLDTLPQMGAAQTLYLALGFQPIPAYRHNPVPGASFWELVL